MPGPKPQFCPKNECLARAYPLGSGTRGLAESRRQGVKSYAVPGQDLAMAALKVGRKMKQLTQLNNPGRPTAYTRQYSACNNTHAVRQMR